MSQQTAIGVPGLGASAGEVAGGQMQKLLVELLDLSLQAKQAHWHVFGSNFLSVHEQLDRVVADARDWADQVAERSIALGHEVDGRATTIARTSTLPVFPEGFLACPEVVSSIADRLESLAATARRAGGELAAVDLGSQDLAVQIMVGLEKHLWMFRAQLA